MKKIKDDNQKFEVFLIAKEKWKSEGIINRIYYFEVVKKGDHWRILTVAPCYGDVPAGLEDIFKTPKDIADYTF